MRARATPWRRWRSQLPSRRRHLPPRCANPSCRRLSLPPRANRGSFQFSLHKAQGRQIALPPLSPTSGKSLLQIGHRRQVSRQLDDTRRATPVRTVPERIVPGNCGGSDLSIESTREDAAITLRQVGVGVAQVQCEHLVGKADADVPGIVISIMDAIRERRGTVETVGGSKPLPPKLAGYVHANAAAAEDRSGRGVFAGDRRIVAPSA